MEQKYSQQESRTPCVLENLEERLTGVMEIIHGIKEDDTVSKQQEDLNRIKDLIGPDEYGAVFVRMHAEYTPIKNERFAGLLQQAYKNSLTGGKKRKRTMKKKHRKSRKSRTFRRKK